MWNDEPETRLRNWEIPVLRQLALESGLETGTSVVRKSYSWPQRIHTYIHTYIDRGSIRKHVKLLQFFVFCCRVKPWPRHRDIHSVSLNYSKPEKCFRQILQTKSIHTITSKNRVGDNAETHGTAGEATDDNEVWRMRVACWITKVTDTHSRHIILIAFPRQQWLNERASLLRHTYTGYVVVPFSVR